MLPAAPKVVIHAPTTLFAGHPCAIEIELTAENPTKIDFVDAQITGNQGWRVGSGNNTVRTDVRYPRLAVRLAEAGVLPAGVTRLATQFTLPADMPPSHELTPAYAHVELKIHVSIPWWPDGRYHFRLPLRIPPGPVTRTPVTMRSTNVADAPRIELSLASTRLVAGEILVGSCAVFHLDDSKERELVVQLVPELQLHRNSRTRERQGSSIQWTLKLPAGSAATSVPFRLPLPADLTPSFRAVTHQLRWWLRATSGSFFSGKVELAMPLEILDSHAAATTAQLVAAPRLADERVAAVFAQFAAASGWRPAPDDDGRNHTLHVREIDDHELSLAHAYRGEAGTFLVGRIAHPGLGLGLSVTPSSALRHVFFRDLEIGDAPFDRAHHVVARSADQTLPFVRAMAPEIMEIGTQLGTLIQWDDDGITYERPVVTVEASDLLAMSQRLQHLASVLGTAARTITPPPGLIVDLDAWRALVQWLRGRTSLGDLSIDGSLDATPVGLALEWDAEGRPHALRAHVGDPTTASELTRALALSVTRPATDPVSHEVVAAQLARWPGEIVRLVIADGVVAASWTLAEVVDAARIRELVEALRSLLGSLDPKAGPYR